MTSSLAATGKDLVVIHLAATPAAGDYTLTLRDRRGVPTVSTVVRLGGSGSGGGSTDAQTLQGLPASAFLRTTGGTLTGPLAFQDGSGVVRTTINTAGIGWRDSAGRLRWSAGASTSGTGGMWVYDAAGVPRIEAAEYLGPGAFVGVADASGTPRAGLIAFPSGDGSVIVADDEGALRGSFGHHATTNSTDVFMADEDGVLRAALGEYVGGADFAIYAADGDERVWLGGDDIFGALTLSDLLGNSTTYWP